MLLPQPSCLQEGKVSAAVAEGLELGFTNVSPGQHSWARVTYSDFTSRVSFSLRAGASPLTNKPAPVTVRHVDIVLLATPTFQTSESRRNIVWEY